MALLKLGCTAKFNLNKMAAVLVENIVKKYKVHKTELIALNDISFEVAKGELFGIVGPDGAGKTSLFRILTTLLLADSGKAAIEGKYKNGNFVVTAESIIPNLEVLGAYKPLLQQFWSKGLFEPLENRYFSLVDRGVDLDGEVELTATEKKTCV